MELKNLYNRKDFNKLYEFGANNAGGVGQDEGFANNAKLKDTYVGKLIYGLFKSISWLWRKVKENYIISRLIAHLTNELLRGVVVYCFQNAIDIKTGEKSKSKTEEESDEFGIIKKSIEFDIDFDNLDELPDDVIERIKVISGLDLSLIKDVENLPDDADAIMKDLYEFLKLHVSNFESLDDDKKEKIKSIYINYLVIQELKKHASKPTLIKTSYQFLHEDISVGGSITVPLDDPRAGRIAGDAVKNTSATIGDLLTKRDKEKYKEFEEYFALGVYDINLAEIEKYVESNSEQKQVALAVNKENLRLIQLTAQELMTPTNDENDNRRVSKLKLKWNKELTLIYASFSKLMNVRDIDIREEIRDLYDDESIKAKSTKYVGDLKDEEKSAKIVEGFGSAIESNDIEFSDLKGDWSYLSFGHKYATRSFDCAIAPVRNNNEFYLLLITNTFISINDNYTVNSNIDDFNKIFKADFLSKKGSKVYIMIPKKNAKLPRKTKKQPNSCFIVNESEGQFYLCKNDGSKFRGSSGANLNEIVNINNKEYITTIEIIQAKKFDTSGVKLKPWKAALNLTNNFSFSHPRIFKDYYRKIYKIKDENIENVLTNLDTIAKK